MLTVDLTGDSDASDTPAPRPTKRAKTGGRAQAAEEIYFEDSDGEICVARQGGVERVRAAEQGKELGDDEELVIDGESGQARFADPPHPSV